MRIDMDKVFAVMGQADPDVLAIDGVDYTLKRVSVADVAVMSSLIAPAPGETDAQRVERILKGIRDMFDGPCPPMLDVSIPDDQAAATIDLDRLLGTVVTIMAMVVESTKSQNESDGDMGNKLARVRTETVRQIEAARANIG